MVGRSLNVLFAFSGNFMMTACFISSRPGVCYSVSIENPMDNSFQSFTVYSRLLSHVAYQLGLQVNIGRLPIRVMLLSCVHPKCKEFVLKTRPFISSVVDVSFAELYTQRGLRVKR